MIYGMLHREEGCLYLMQLSEHGKGDMTDPEQNQVCLSRRTVHYLLVYTILIYLFADMESMFYGSLLMNRAHPNLYIPRLRDDNLTVARVLG